MVPGWSLVVRDLLTGRRFRVVEPEISEDVRSEQILLSAVLTVDGVSTLLGCGSHAVASDVRVMAGQMREYHAEGAWLTRAALLDITTQVCSEYRGACDGESVIELETYGEAPEPLLLRWNVSSPFGEMFERLRSLSVVGRKRSTTRLDQTASRLLMSCAEPPPAPRTGERLAAYPRRLAGSRLVATRHRRTPDRRDRAQLGRQRRSWRPFKPGRMPRSDSLPMLVRD